MLTFPTRTKTWHLTQAQVESWAVAFPARDVLAECRRALAWVEASPARRKTARGMPRFLVAWLNRATDTGKREGGKPPIGHLPSYTSLDWTCLHVIPCENRQHCLVNSQLGRPVKP